MFFLKAKTEAIFSAKNFYCKKYAFPKISDLPVLSFPCTLMSKFISAYLMQHLNVGIVALLLFFLDNKNIFSKAF